MCIYIYVDIYWLHYITLHYTTLYYCKLSCIILCCWALWFPTRPDPPKGTSISRRFSPAMATVSESPPRVLPSSSVSTRRRTWKWLSSFWDHSLQLYRLHQVAHLSWMTGRGIHLWWRNPSIWRSFEGYMIYYIYIYQYSDFFSRSPWPDLCPSLPGIDLSLPGLEQLKAVETIKRKWKSQSPWEKKNEESSGTPTVSGLKTVDGSEIRPSPVEVGSFSHYLQGF